MRSITEKHLSSLTGVLILLISLYWYYCAQFINHDISLGLFFAEVILDPNKTMYLDFYEEGLPFNQYIYLIPSFIGSLLNSKETSILFVQIFTIFSIYLLSRSLPNKSKTIFLIFLSINALWFSELFGHYQMICVNIILSFIFIRQYMGPHQIKLAPLAAISLLIRPQYFPLVILGEVFIYLRMRDRKLYLKTSKSVFLLILLILLGFAEATYQALTKEEFVQFFLSYFTQRDTLKDSFLSLFAYKAPFLLLFLYGKYDRKKDIFFFSTLSLVLSMLVQRDWLYHFLIFYYLIILHIFMSTKENVHVFMAKVFSSVTILSVIFSIITHSRMPSLTREYTFFNKRVDDNYKLFKSKKFKKAKVAYISKNIMPKFPNVYLLDMELTQKNIALESFKRKDEINLELFDEVIRDIRTKEPAFIIIEKNEPPALDIELEDELFKIAPSLLLQYNKDTETSNIVIYKVRENSEEK